MSAQMALRGVDTSRPHSGDLEQWFTPPRLAERFVQWSLAGADGIEDVLEPTAGDGAIVRQIVRQSSARVVAIEIDRRFADALRSDAELIAACQVPEIVSSDFLSWHPGARCFDVAICNPPFAIATKVIDHSLRFCKRACAIVPATVKHSEDRFDFWRCHAITREAVLANRPRFIGAKNMSPATDFLLIEVVRMTSIEVNNGIRPSCRMEAPWWL